MINSKPTNPKNSTENEQAGPQPLTKIPAAVNSGMPRKDGTRHVIGKIYLPSEWIGQAVVCSTIWNTGEAVPNPRKTHPEIIRDEKTPGKITTEIKRTVGRHNGGRKISGCIFLPREWIWKDVLIIPASTDQSTAGTPTAAAGIPAGSTAPQGAEE